MDTGHIYMVRIWDGFGAIIDKTGIGRVGPISIPIPRSVLTIPTV